MLKYLIIMVSLIINFVLIFILLKEENSVTKMYSTKIDGTPKYKERIEKPDGDIVERFLIDGNLSQEFIYFSDGQEKEIRNYQNNEKHGDWIIYYKNDDSINKKRKKKYSNYNKGKLLELVEYRYDGSIIRLSVPISENTTMITNYYSNGQIESSGRMLVEGEDERERYGPWIWYNQQGFVIQEKSFD